MPERADIARQRSWSRLRDMPLKLKIILLSWLVSVLVLISGFSYFAYESYWLNVKTALGGLMNFTDAKQQGVIRFIDQNEKLARQLADLASRADARTLRSQFQSVVATDIFKLEEHPFKGEILNKTRTIPTWNVYVAIDHVVDNRIVVSSDPKREGRRWNKDIDLSAGYSDPYYEGDVPFLTFAAPAASGTVYVHADARMLTNIVNGEIGNLAGDMGAFYLAGVGESFDYYIVNKDNLLITESRVRAGQFLKGHGSELPWRTTMEQAGVVCSQAGTYTTDARCTTGCREAMGFYLGATGKKMLGTSMPFYDSRWTLVVEQEADELLLPMWKTLGLVLGGLVVIQLLAGYVFSKLIEHFIDRPLRSLQTAIEKVDEDKDFTRRVEVDSDDEIGKLGKSFNRLIHNIDDLHHNLEERIEQRTQELQVTNEQLQEEIHEREFIEKALRENSEYLRVAAVAFETHEAIMITDKNGMIVRVNQAFQTITGYAAEEVLGKNPRILKSGRQSQEFYAAMWQQLLEQGAWEGEIWDRRKSGQIYPKWLTITAVKDGAGDTTEYVAIFNDITSRKQAEEDIRNLAFYDSLTLLPNRRLLMDRMRTAFSVSARSNLYGALLFIDMDKFKVLNDTQGHDYGDLMLIEVARRLQSCVREVDTVARLGGDEFVVLLEEIDATAEVTSQRAAAIAEKVRATLAASYRLKEIEHSSSPSIGVTLFRANEHSVEEVFRHADMAMYQAKEAGRNAVRFFDPAMQAAVEKRSALESDLRHAVPERQLQLYFQVQVDHEQRPVGAEALVRWVHPVRGMVPPMDFIPIAEESSLIIDIGCWVLETAIMKLHAWSQDPLMKDLSLAVNVSAKQFRQADFVEKIAEGLRHYAIEPSRLKLELTESLVLNDLEDMIAKMQAIRALGVQVSLDDFGTGYSSLSYLKRLPLDQLKIDQSFVRDLSTDEGDAVMVRAIIDMAKNFALDVIAEGVETREQLDFLAQNGCKTYQGYLFSKPLPVDQFEALLRTNPKI